MACLVGILASALIVAPSPTLAAVGSTWSPPASGALADGPPQPDASKPTASATPGALDGRATQLSQPTCDHAPDRLIVRFKSRSAGREHAALYAQAESRQLDRVGLVPGLELVRTAGSLADAAAVLRAAPDVEYVELDCIVRADALPNDPGLSDQWALRNTGQTGGTAGADIHAPAAWNVRADASSVVVAVIDTGIQLDHPDLSSNLWSNSDEIAGNGIDDDHNGYVDDRHGYDFVNDDSDPTDDYFHGTHVAGTIGARGNNGIGVTGVAWSTKLMALKAFDSSGNGYISAILAALNYAVDNGARISNNSYSTPDFSRSLYDAFAAAGAAGMLSVAAAGNDSVNDDEAPRYPASFRLNSVISVAATTDSDELADFSNFGIYNVHIAAPGSSILSTIPGSSYGFSSGTSMATPHVAGVAALLAAAHPTWTAAQVRDRILGTSRLLPSLSGKTWTGGILDAAAALGGAASVPPPSYPTPTTQALATSAVPDPAPPPATPPTPPTFGPSTIVDASVRRLDAPQITLDSAGRPSIAYNRALSGVQVASLQAGTWSKVQLTNAYAEFGWLDLLVDGSDAPVVASQRYWSDIGAYWDPGIVVARPGAADPTVDRVTASCPDADSCFMDWQPMLARDSAGTLHMAFTRDDASGVSPGAVIAPSGSAPSVPGAGVYYASDDGTGWDVVRLTSQTGDAVAAIAVSSTGTVHLAFLRRHGSESGLYYVTNSSGSWKILRMTDNVEDRGVALGIDAAGVVHLVYARNGLGLYYRARSVTGTRRRQSSSSMPAGRSTSCSGS